MQSDSDDEEEGEMEEENEGESGPSAQDPRAGRVDVTIPQLMLDYEKLAEDLLAAGGEKTVGQVQRKILYKYVKAVKTTIVLWPTLTKFFFSFAGYLASSASSTRAGTRWPPS